jgi:hypothetical protein
MEEETKNEIETHENDEKVKFFEVNIPFGMSLIFSTESPNGK